MNTTNRMPSAGFGPWADRVTPWHLTAQPALRLRDRLRLLVGVPLYVRFTSPDGTCSAACTITHAVQRAWPQDEVALRRARLTIAQPVGDDAAAIETVF